MVNVFAIPVFFICFRECLETTIIVSVLLSFLKQTLGPKHDPQTYKRLRKQVWYGLLVGFVVCLVVGCAFIGSWYTLGANYYGVTQDVWEGSFALLASLIITAMGAALLRVSKLQDKWRVKLTRALEAKKKDKKKEKGSFKRWCEKYAMFLLPLVTVLREGLEAVVFIGGVALGLPAESFPLAIGCGLGAGCLIGVAIYKGGNHAPLQIFLIISTCFLYLVAAGLFSKGVWYLEAYEWIKAVGTAAAESGSGPGSYDIRKSVWHVNCCNPEINGGGGWGVFNSLFGWQNSATYGSVISYNIYWLAVIAGFMAMRYNEKTGHWPFMKPKYSDETAVGSNANDLEAADKGFDARPAHEVDSGSSQGGNDFP